MNKIAIKLLILSLIATVVIVFFLNKVVNKPSHLLELVPNSAVAVVKVNTRDIAKDVYRYGGFTLDSIAFFNEEYPYFTRITDPRKTGINVYSELFLFQDEVKEGKYNCLLFNLNSLNNFKTFCATNSLLAVANGKESTIFYSKKDSFYVWIKEKEAALLFNVQSPNHLVQIIDKISAKKVDEEKPFKKVLEAGNNIVVWQSQSNVLLGRYFPFMGEYAEFYGDFITGKFEYKGKATKILEYNRSIFNPTFVKTPKAIVGTEFSGDIIVENKEIHPLTGVIRKWKSKR
jgi:hypothetical protein